MGPKKAEKPAKGSDEASVVLEYLRKQNRPYNANDIFQNLHGQIGKTGLVKVLNQLAADGSISLKTYGKQQVFVARQDEKDLPSEEEIDRIDADIAERKGELEALQTQTKQLATTLSHLKSSLTLAELQERYSSLTAENERNAERLRVLKEGENMISPEESKAINAAFDKNRKLWRARRKMCLEIMDTILESSPMKKAEFIETVGIETDEAVGAKIDS